MYRQLLFCVEANKRSRTDYVYIKDIIDYYYNYDNNKTSIKPIFMGSKYNYNKKDVTRQISEKIRQFDGETNVLICVDTDSIQANYEDKETFDKLTLYCNNNNYELIWFCEDIEEVCWGETIVDCDKVKASERFRRKSMVKEISANKMESSRLSKGYSNILRVLDKYFIRKK